MCYLCKKYLKGEIDAKTAFDTLNKAATVELDVNHKADLYAHLLELNELIMSKECPMPETDKDADSDWTKKYYGDKQ